MCYTESGLNYNVIHTGKHDSTTIGICGLKYNYWGNIIGDIDINSLEAGSIVLSYLLDKYDGNLRLALKHFKGVKKNKVIVKHTIKTYKKIKD